MKIIDKKNKHITLKEAAKTSGYTPDYIGYLVRKSKIKGKETFTGVSWLTTEKDIKKYQKLITKKEKKIISDDLKKFIYDILPPQKIKEVGKEISGIKNYKTRAAKIFAISWRLSFATVVLFVLIGICPVGIFQKLVGAFTEEEKTINIYSTQSIGSWQNYQNVVGSPDIGPEGDFNSFSEINSAMYQGGSSSFILSGFNATEIELEKIIKTESDLIPYQSEEPQQQEQEEQKPEEQKPQEDLKEEPEEQSEEVTNEEEIETEETLDIIEDSNI